MEIRNTIKKVDKLARQIEDMTSTITISKASKSENSLLMLSDACESLIEVKKLLDLTERNLKVIAVTLVKAGEAVGEKYELKD